MATRKSVVARSLHDAVSLKILLSYSSLRDWC